MRSKLNTSGIEKPPNFGAENPVFAYRAGFRNKAKMLQAFLWKTGALGIGIGLLCGVSYVVDTSWLAGNRGSLLKNIMTYAFFAGCLFCVLGLIWGYWWHEHMRSSFQSAYGLEGDEAKPK